MKKRRQGFTLIELLVVIAIIGILSTVVLINLTGFQKRARGNQMQGDVNTMLANYDTYRSSHFGVNSAINPTTYSYSKDGSAHTKADWSAKLWKFVLPNSPAPTPPKASSTVKYEVVIKPSGNYSICAIDSGPSGKGDLDLALSGSHNIYAAVNGQIYETSGTSCPDPDPTPTPSP